MFRKLVSRLPFSPALVGQLGFYARRLRQEEVTRRLGLVFTVLALVVQSFAVFSPPESANAAGPGDFVRGGISSLEEFLHLYDSNSGDLKDIFTSAGITRQEIAATHLTTYNSKGIITHGRVSQFSAAQGERQYTYYKSNGSTGIVYAKPQSLWDKTSTQIKNGTTYNAWVGYSKKAGWFGIAKHCANLITKDYLPPAEPPACPAGTIGTPPNCTKPPAPAAECSGLSVAKISRTKVKLTASSSTANGATIKGYTFSVKKDGAEVYSKRIDSSELKVSTEEITLESSGRYNASITVHTSLGDKTAKGCEKSFVIEKPEACPLNPDLTKEDVDCQPCPGDNTIWVKDEACASQIVQSKTAKNLTQNAIDATTVTAIGSDKIQYSLQLKNVGKEAGEMPIIENLGDVLEYAQLVDNGGGTFDAEARTLTWPTAALQPGESQQRDFIVRVLKDIPATPQGQSDKISYDCTMTNTFGTSININVDCPTPKVVEAVVTELPQTGARENMIFAGLLLAVVTYFYARARQLGREVRLIRRDLNSGAI